MLTKASHAQISLKDTVPQNRFWVRLHISCCKIPKVTAEVHLIDLHPSSVLLVLQIGFAAWARSYAA